jgi:periplasmic protein CpxP/Spy
LPESKRQTNHKKMKNLTFAMLLVLMTGITAFAQDMRTKERHSPEERAQKQTEMMAKQLELSEDQKAKILAINLEGAKKREAEMAAKKAEMDARREEMKAMREEMKSQDEAIKEVLTEEQRAKWEELKQSQRDRRGRRPGGQVGERGDIPRKRGGN